VSVIYYCQIHPLLAKKISSLAENTSPKTVFDEVLATAGRDTITKDVSRLRGGWPMQDAFYVSLIAFRMNSFNPLLCRLSSVHFYSRIDLHIAMISYEEKQGSKIFLVLCYTDMGLGIRYMKRGLTRTMLVEINTVRG